MPPQVTSSCSHRICLSCGALVGASGMFYSARSNQTVPEVRIESSSCLLKGEPLLPIEVFGDAWRHLFTWRVGRSMCPHLVDVVMADTGRHRRCQGIQNCSRFPLGFCHRRVEENLGEGVHLPFLLIRHFSSACRQSSFCSLLKVLFQDVTLIGQSCVWRLLAWRVPCKMCSCCDGSGLQDDMWWKRLAIFIKQSREVSTTAMERRRHWCAAAVHSVFFPSLFTPCLSTA